MMTEIEDRLNLKCLPADEHAAKTPDSAPAPVVPLDDSFDWCIVEIMGHRRHAGRGREEERFGIKGIRIDVPIKGTLDVWQSHFYAGSAIFSHTLTDEATVLRMNKPSEPYRYRLAAPEPENDDLFDGDAMDGDGGDDS